LRWLELLLDCSRKGSTPICELAIYWGSHPSTAQSKVKLPGLGALAGRERKFVEYPGAYAPGWNIPPLRGWVVQGASPLFWTRRYSRMDSWNPTPSQKARRSGAPGAGDLNLRR